MFVDAYQQDSDDDIRLMENDGDLESAAEIAEAFGVAFSEEIDGHYRIDAHDNNEDAKRGQDGQDCRRQCVDDEPKRAESPHPLDHTKHAHKAQDLQRKVTNKNVIDCNHRSKTLRRGNEDQLFKI